MILTLEFPRCALIGLLVLMLVASGLYLLFAFIAWDFWWLLPADCARGDYRCTLHDDSTGGRLIYAYLTIAGTAAGTVAGCIFWEQD